MPSRTQSKETTTTETEFVYTAKQRGGRIMDAKQLKDLQSLPLKYKIMISQERIREWYEHWDGQVYVSFSGGKDSTVLLHIVRQLYPEVPAVFCDTGLEYPEIRRFVKKHENVVWLKPRMNFKRVIEKYGYPVVSKVQAQYLFEIASCKKKDGVNYRKRLNGNKWGRGKVSEKWKYLIDAPFKISHMCCHVMKKEPFRRYGKETRHSPIIGIMADESSMRSVVYMQNGGCNFFENKRVKSWPLGFWTEQDVWAYLRTNNVPYSLIYDMGYYRTGCMFCMFGVHLEPEPNRFQKMQVTHPKQWEYCMFKLGLAEVLDYIGVPYNNDNEGLWTTKDLIEME